VQRQRRRASACGQTTAEYALILGGIAVVCIVAVVFLGHPIDGLFRKPVALIPPSQPFTPPVIPGTLPEPTSLADCAEDGWRSYAFDTQAECEAYVNGHAGPEPSG
jgi:Flp pilus assembly pilin Flp